MLLWNTENQETAFLQQFYDSDDDDVEKGVTTGDGRWWRLDDLTKWKCSQEAFEVLSSRFADDLGSDARPNVNAELIDGAMLDSCVSFSFHF